MRVKILVTQRDITQGKRADSNLCPVARAVRRLVKRSENVGVTSSSILINKYNFEALPAKATTWINRYDAGATVLPFQFTQNIPARYLRGH